MVSRINSISSLAKLLEDLMIIEILLFCRSVLISQLIDTGSIASVYLINSKNSLHSFFSVSCGDIFDTYPMLLTTLL